MDLLLNWIVQGCAATLLVAAVLRVVPGRAPMRYLVWWAALLTVALMPLGAPDPVTGLETAATAGPVHGPLVPVIVMPAGPWIDSAFPILWVAWVAWWGGRLTADLARTWRARAASRPVPAHLEARLRHWSRLAARGRRAGLVLSERVASAAVLGTGAPVIALSPALFDRLGPDDIDLIVVHERAHVQRRDDVAHLLQQIVFAILGWHPAVWWIGRQLDLEREIACDEMAAQAAGSRKRYAACLVHLASLPGTRVALQAPAAISRSGLGTRIHRLIVSRPATRWRTACGTAAGVATLAGSAWVSVNTPVFAIAAPPGGAVSAEAPRQREPESVAVAGGTIPYTMRGEDDPRPGEIAAPAPLSPSASRATDAARAPAATPARIPELVQRFEAGRQPQPSAPPDAVPPSGAYEIVAVPLDALPGRMIPPGARQPHVDPGRPAAETTTPWGAAADAGMNIGRGSKKAAVATAGVFSRFGKQIAGSF